MPIPLEDNFNDIIGKAQRGFKLDDDHLARKAGVSVSDLGRVQSGQVVEEVIRRVARSLELGEQALVESARKAWYPRAQEIDGLASFHTRYENMTVNAYLVWDAATRNAVVFDTGADAEPILKLIRQKDLTVTHLFLTHTHGDHIGDLDRLKRETGAAAFVSEREPLGGAESFGEGRAFASGGLSVETRLTAGHSSGGTTFLVTGLAGRVAVVGDAIFAGSMGGGLVSYVEALGNNRKKILTLPDDTALCPGHGPLTTVGEEKRHNPFFPEFQRP